MKLIFDPRQRLHRPSIELHNGGWVPHVETAARIDSILAALGQADEARDFGIDPILRVHDPDYVDFLRTAFADWKAAGRDGDALGYAWPVVRRRPVTLDRIDARLGRFSFDASTPIGEGSWDSAYWSAQSALTALDHVLAGDTRIAFALCRPPGHHCGADYCGGYSYLNSAAIAAAEAAHRGRKVAILDIDYHHGNGTQDIFYERGDVAFVSIHADPRSDYPFFWGHADETGSGDGVGKTLNIPLPRGTGAQAYCDALDRACDAVIDHQPDLLILSFGADTYAGDPISFFTLDTADYARIGARIAQLGLPCVVTMEGGYAVDRLGDNVATLIGSLDPPG